MVRYLGSEDSITVTVQEAALPTRLALSADAAVENSEFTVRAKLEYQAGGPWVPLPGATISFTFATVEHASGATGSDGVASARFLAFQGGVFPLVASYAGTGGAQSAQASLNVSVGGAGAGAGILVAAGVATLLTLLLASRGRGR